MKPITSTSGRPQSPQFDIVSTDYESDNDFESDEEDVENEERNRKIWNESEFDHSDALHATISSDATA